MVRGGAACPVRLPAAALVVGALIVHRQAYSSEVVRPTADGRAVGCRRVGMRGAVGAGSPRIDKGKGENEDCREKRPAPETHIEEQKRYREAMKVV